MRWSGTRRLGRWVGSGLLVASGVLLVLLWSSGTASASLAPDPVQGVAAVLGGSAGDASDDAAPESATSSEQPSDEAEPGDVLSSTTSAVAGLVDGADSAVSESAASSEPAESESTESERSATPTGSAPPADPSEQTAQFEQTGLVRDALSSTPDAEGAAGLGSLASASESPHGAASTPSAPRETAPRETAPPEDPAPSVGSGEQSPLSAFVSGPSTGHAEPAAAEEPSEVQPSSPLSSVTGLVTGAPRDEQDGGSTSPTLTHSRAMGSLGAVLGTLDAPLTDTSPATGPVVALASPVLDTAVDPVVRTLDPVTGSVDRVLGSVAPVVSSVTRPVLEPVGAMTASLVQPLTASGGSLTSSVLSSVAGPVIGTALPVVGVPPTGIGIATQGLLPTGSPNGPPTSGAGGEGTVPPTVPAEASPPTSGLAWTTPRSDRPAAPATYGATRYGPVAADAYGHTFGSGAAAGAAGPLEPTSTTRSGSHAPLGPRTVHAPGYASGAGAASSETGGSSGQQAPAGLVTALAAMAMMCLFLGRRREAWRPLWRTYRPLVSPA